MKNKRILSAILLFFMFISLFSSHIMVGAESGSSDETPSKAKRDVYLHAQNGNPVGIVHSSTVIKDEPFNLYFSIDNPNKGNYNSNENDLTVEEFVNIAVSQKKVEILPSAEQRADELGIVDATEREAFIEEYLEPILALESQRAEQIIRHEEKQYDLNGYTVRIYYDKNYFKLQDGANSAAPIDYTIPDKSISDTDTDESNREPGNNSSGSISHSTGYSAYWESVGYDSRKGMDYAEVTVFFYGSFLPQKKGDSQGNKWYDLCALPLVPIKTGTTKVSVEVGGDSAKKSLVLFSKHEDTPGFKKEFDFSAVDGGVHTINIVNSLRPEPPVASPLPLDFVKGDSVKLVCGDPGCTPGNEKHDIYYCLDGVLPFVKYEGQELNFTKTTTVSCYSVKKTDIQQEYKSETVSFKYEILPDKPVLFVDIAGAPITNVYNSDSPFSVYCDTEEVYDNEVGTDVNIYYTFSDINVEDFVDSNGKFKTDGQNPVSEWVKVEKGLGLRVDIDKTVNMKLVTVKENSVTGQEISDTSSYFLGIKPDAVVATPALGTDPGTVQLTAQDGCKIYYTTDGSDPITNGVEYCFEIPVSKDTLIRAVAEKDGVFSDISDFEYTVTNNTDSVISSNYPSGEYAGGIKVSLSSDKPDDRILYSVDGSEPSIPYTGEIAVDKSAVIRAKVEGSDEVFEFSYKIKPLAPVFAPTSTIFTKGDSVTIYCRETVNDGLNESNNQYYTLYYTLDGSDPTVNPQYNTANSPVNTAVVPINDYTVIKAAVKTADGVWSDVVTNTYDVVSYKIAPPIPTLTPGYYEGDKKFTGFFEEQDGVEIYYTISYEDVYEKDPIASDDAPNIKYVPGTEFELTDRMIIKAIAVNKTLGLKSDVAVYEYVVTPEEHQINSTCYADKNSGIYDMTADDFSVNLYSKNPSDVISYKVNDGNWVVYTQGEPVVIEGDSTLYVMGSDGVVISYTYEFVPKPPVSSLTSGRYALKEPPYQTTIMLPEGYSASDYYLFYRDNVAGIDSLANGNKTIPFDITKSISYKAYVVDKRTGKKSESAVFYYIVEPEGVSGGEIYTLDPYFVKSGDTKYISTHKLSEKGYNEGIKLTTKSTGTKIKYMYTYHKTDGSAGGTDYQFYSANNPIMVTSSMTDITVYAYLTDLFGTEIEGTEVVFYYNFEDILVPQFSTDSRNINNDYPNDSDYIIYYTLDGVSSPSDPNNASRIRYEGGKINLTKDTTIKTVYYKSCDDPECPCASGESTLCENYVYGAEGTFYYEAPKYIYAGGGGGSSGGSSAANKRRYTKDIFGNEHVTHISYIKGYPNGKVKADGNITREEVTSMLYRTRDKKYDKPFKSTGKLFPDVEPTRWSVTEIEFMASEKIVLGYPNGKFKPANNLTRAEFAALIYRYCELEDADVTNKFSDLSEEHWAYNEILALLKTGLIQGYEDNTFRPERYITRAEVITVMNKILGRKPLASYVKSLNFNPFIDLEPDKWYYTDVLEATITHDYYLNANDYEYKWENWK